MLLRALSVLLGLWGLLLSLGLLTGHLAWSTDGPALPGTGDTACAPDDAEPAVGEGAAGSPAGVAPPPAPVMATRRAICEDAVGLPRIDLHSVAGAPLLSVHCGTRIRWLGLDPTDRPGDDPGLRVEAEQRMAPRGAGHLPRPVPPVLLAADPARGQPTTWVLGGHYLDTHGRAVEGGLWALRRLAAGGVSAPTRIAGSLPLRVLAGHFAGEGAALAWLDAGDADNPHALFVQAGPAATARAARYAVGDATAAAALDLDGDGDTDVVLAGTESSAQWWLAGPPHGEGDAGDAPAAPVGASLGPMREVVIGDVNGDGTADALWSGDGLWVTRAAPAGSAQARALSPTPIEGTQCHMPDCPQDVQLRDVDGDGALDIVQYRHPELSYRRNRGGLVFDAPRTLTRLQGDGMAVVQTLTVPRPGGGLTLWVLGHPVGEPARVELAVVAHAETQPLVGLGGDALPVAEAPLLSEHEVR